MRDVVELNIALVGREWGAVREHLERYAAKTLAHREGAFTLAVGRVAMWCLDYFIPLKNGLTLHPKLCTADVDKREDEPALVRKLLRGVHAVCVIGDSHDDVDEHLRRRREKPQVTSVHEKDVFRALDAMIERFAAAHSAARR